MVDWCNRNQSDNGFHIVSESVQTKDGIKEHMKAIRFESKEDAMTFAMEWL